LEALLFHTNDRVDLEGIEERRLPREALRRERRLHRRVVEARANEVVVAALEDVLDATAQHAQAEKKNTNNHQTDPARAGKTALEHLLSEANVIATSVTHHRDVQIKIHQATELQV